MDSSSSSSSSSNTSSTIRLLARPRDTDRHPTHSRHLATSSHSSSSNNNMPVLHIHRTTCRWWRSPLYLQQQHFLIAPERVATCILVSFLSFSSSKPQSSVYRWTCAQNKRPPFIFLITWSKINWFEWILVNSIIYVTEFELSTTPEKCYLCLPEKNLWGLVGTLMSGQSHPFFIHYTRLQMDRLRKCRLSSTTTITLIL